MDELQRQAEEYKARLVARERRAAAELVRDYGFAYRRIQLRVEELTAQIEKALLQGEIISSSFLYERDRLTRLSLEIEIEMRRFSVIAAGRVTDEQRAAIRLASTDARSLINVGTNGSSSSVNLSGSLNRDAVERMAGFTGDGTPLRTYLDRLAPEMASRVSSELVAGVATGAHARVIASRVRQVMGGGLARSLVISRNETTRVYRAAQLSNYNAYGDVVLKWRWQATLGPRTCIVCWMMHGREFDLDTPFESHINCACVPVPITVNTPQAQTGEELFRNLEEGYQRQILGSAKFEAFKSGKLNLSSLIGENESEEWGKTLYERSLKEATR